MNSASVLPARRGLPAKCVQQFVCMPCQFQLIDLSTDLGVVTHLPSVELGLVISGNVAQEPE